VNRQGSVREFHVAMRGVVSLHRRVNNVYSGESHRFCTGLSQTEIVGVAGRDLRPSSVSLTCIGFMVQQQTGELSLSCARPAAEGDRLRGY